MGDTALAGCSPNSVNLYGVSFLLATFIFCSPKPIKHDSLCLLVQGALVVRREEEKETWLG